MSPREAALHTAATFLRPLASFMLKCGLTWREFSALGKKAFVEAATHDYGINGRPTNISRVALLCGLARKDVKRQRDLIAENAIATPEEKTTDATRVLSAWHQDSAYLTEDGVPAVLTRNEFNALCGDYCSEIAASTILKELLRVGAIVQPDDDHLQVQRRYYMPVNNDAQWMMTAGHYVADIATTISHNIDLDNSERSRFLGRATETLIPIDNVDEFRAFLEEEGQVFLERVDDWLADRNRVSGDGDAAAKVRLGVGVFQIQNTAKVTDNDTDI